MTIRINYGTGVAAIPTSIIAVMDRATKTDLKLLLLLASDPLLLAGNSLGDCVLRVAERLGCTAAQIETSLAFWRGAGVLQLDGEATAVPALEKTAPRDNAEEAKSDDAEARTDEAEARTDEAEARTDESTDEPAAQPQALRRKPSRPDELPRYTSEELTALLEKRKEAAKFINESQTIWGKIFNTYEINILLGLSDYLGLEWDYILTLLQYCVTQQKKRGISKSLHYVEKTAFSFYDEGVNSLPSLQEKLRELERMDKLVGQLRTLFGMGERALTPKEKKCFSTWLYEYRFDLDIIRHAYELTVDAKGSPNIHYMNSILTNWNGDNLRTLEDIQAADERFRAERDKEKAERNKASNGKERAAKGSFDTEDFFAAAVRRSFGGDVEEGS